VLPLILKAFIINYYNVNNKKFVLSCQTINSQLHQATVSEAFQNHDFYSGSRPEGFQNHSPDSVRCKDVENPITPRQLSGGKRTVLQSLRIYCRIIHTSFNENICLNYIFFREILISFKGGIAIAANCRVSFSAPYQLCFHSVQMPGSAFFGFRRAGSHHQ